MADMSENARDQIPPSILSVAQATQRASALIMRYFLGAQDDLDVRHKDDDSPVSRADTESSELLVDALGRAFPGVPVLSEEDEMPSYAERSRWKRFFLVDPLDGTKEFLRGSQDFAVNVALVEDGNPVWGVMQCPAHNLLMAGGKGIGTWKSDGLGVEWNALQAPVPQGDNALRAVLSQSHRHGSEQPALDRFGVASVIRRGSSLKFLLVAQGLADVYFRKTPTWEWDTAAGQAILEGLDCVVCDALGAPLRYNRVDPLNGPFLACPRLIQELCLERIHRASTP
jgi:3'(2'), 5'-bisphosphate nucleotidase